VDVISPFPEVNVLSRCLRKCLTSCFILIAGLPALASPVSFGPAEPVSKITARVYNYAQVAPKTLTEAKKEASRIFHEADIESRWLDCRLSMTDSEGYPDCQQEPFGPTDLVLRILPRSMARRQAFPSKTFGFALSCPPGEGGFIGNVFYDRIEELAQWGQISHLEALGHVMAHEIGHLLLGSGSHSAKGIMRAQWNHDDLQCASQGSLRFTQEQSRRMHANISARR
jgi:hypothetical protein